MVKITKQELIRFLEANGWKRDPRAVSSWRSPKLAGYRFTLWKRVVRFERRGADGKWRRVRSGYYNNIALDNHGQLVGLNRWPAN